MLRNSIWYILYYKENTENQYGKLQGSRQLQKQSYAIPSMTINVLSIIITMFLDLTVIVIRVNVRKAGVLPCV